MTSCIHFRRATGDDGGSASSRRLHTKEATSSLLCHIRWCSDITSASVNPPAAPRSLQSCSMVTERRACMQVGQRRRSVDFVFVLCCFFWDFWVAFRVSGLGLGLARVRVRGDHYAKDLRTTTRMTHSPHLSFECGRPCVFPIHALQELARSGIAYALDAT